MRRFKELSRLLKAFDLKSMIGNRVLSFIVMSPTTSITLVARSQWNIYTLSFVPKSHLFYCYASDWQAIAKEAGRRIGTVREQACTLIFFIGGHKDASTVSAWAVSVIDFAFVT
ncbi:hypothetical protein QVD17_25879 [Tagetes erecta]|uniref:Uncharacterized protein n=1 Tax=Tagetes erecta TaxID=13708 RepID=A0AAD8NQB7_TARER|nr:hypothetical protein QVD17_25879 [Tagetes erecta]